MNTQSVLWIANEDQSATIMLKGDYMLHMPSAKQTETFSKGNNVQSHNSLGNKLRNMANGMRDPNNSQEVKELVRSLEIQASEHFRAAMITGDLFYR